ncbi:MAG: cytochrome-c peroxidase, partial [Thermoanaerobaculia bacterium]
MQKSTPRKALIVLLLLAIAGLAFLFVPIPALEGGLSDPETTAAFESRADEHFQKILAGRNLDRPFPPPKERPENPTSPEKVKLGRLLYFDPVLSGDNDVSCAHCHHPDLGFSDNRGRSMGKGGRGLGPSRTGGALLRRGSPTVWNASYNHLQFWDG